MKIQAGIIVVLLGILVALEVRSEFQIGTNTEPVATPSVQTEFSVTSTGEGQFVMRANDKIFFCVNNRCTGIQLITAPKTAEQANPDDTRG